MTDPNSYNANPNQEGLNRPSSTNISITTPGHGGGGGSGGSGFGGSGSSLFTDTLGFPMKDWLIIMVIVIAGLTMLTHTTGVPGQYGPGGGLALFGATGHLMSVLAQLLTTFLSPPIFLFAYACYKSKRFRMLFPLGKRFNIQAFCDEMDPLGDAQLAGLKDAKKVGGAQRALNTLDGKAVKVAKKTSNPAKTFLNAVRKRTGFETPAMLEAAGRRDLPGWLKACTEAGLTVPDISKMSGNEKEACTARMQVGKAGAEASVGLGEVPAIQEIMTERLSEAFDVDDAAARLLALLATHPVIVQT